MVAFFLWIILFILCWPVAVLALIAYPFVWLILLPYINLSLIGLWFLNFWLIKIIPSILLFMAAGNSVLKEMRAQQRGEYTEKAL